MRLPVAGAAPACARCAARGPTCCEPEEGVALAPLTPGDVARIQAATRLPQYMFVKVRRVSDAERRAIDEENPELNGLVVRGRLKSLAKTGRACVFHVAGTGCSLAWDVRPLICRRFPFVGAGRRIRVQPGGECLAVEEARNLPELFTILGMTEEQTRALDRQIRRELAADATPRGR